MSKPFYVTTPIYYVNARPHLGHAYSTIIADVMNRFHRMGTDETFFLTGTDEHGEKVMRAAKRENLTPLEYANKISELYQSLLPALKIRHTTFIRTTEKYHIHFVKEMLQRLYDSGDIYFSEYQGKYCFECERFYTDRELSEGLCPDHKKAPEILKESNYFFKMSRYQDWLVGHIEKNPEFIRPERYRNEVLSFLREPLEDLCISRPKSRVSWGITLPFDPCYVAYVWFDALFNYISALSHPHPERFDIFWPHVQHIVAKDILKQHAIYWPTILKASGIPPYQHLNVHGYWNADQMKMSKSVGNVIDPLVLIDIYGVDAFRYYLVRQMVFGFDTSFNESEFIKRINTELANDLGNLFSRVLAMVHKYFRGVVPKIDFEVEEELHLGLKEASQNTIEQYQSHMESFKFHKAMGTVWNFINTMNKCIDVTQPWLLFKHKHSQNELKVVIYSLLEGLRIVSGLIYPVMPDKAEIMQRHLGLDPSAPFYKFKILSAWKMLIPGTTLPKTVTLFPRIEGDTVQQRKSSASFPFKPQVSTEDFSRVDLRIAKVVRAEVVPRAKELMKLTVNMGVERTIIAKIAKNYTADELLGKKVVVAANLKPLNVMGVLSEGILLTATDGEDTITIIPDKSVKEGTELS